MLTIAEVAERLRVGREAVQSWIGSGELPALDVSPSGSSRRRWRIREDDLEAFTLSRTQRKRIRRVEIPDILSTVRRRRR